MKSRLPFSLRNPGSWPVGLSFALFVSTTLLIGWIDFITGPELFFSAFHVVPLGALAWVARRLRWAIAGAFVATLVWWGADRLSGHVFSHPWSEVWNAFIRFSAYALVGVLLVRLRRAHDRLDQLARFDFLSGLLNARAFRHEAEEERRRAERNGASFSLLLFDLDRFKEVNDTQGHAVGDRVIEAVGEVLASSIREVDHAGRLGGDEFGVAFFDLDLDAARVVGEKIREALVRRFWDEGWKVSASIGIAVWAKAPEQLGASLKIADSAMYLAKSKGRDRVEVVSFDRGA